MLGEIMGIQGAKRASGLIPLCRPLPLDQVRIVTEPDESASAIDIFSLVSSFC